MRPTSPVSPQPDPVATASEESCGDAGVDRRSVLSAGVIGAGALGVAACGAAEDIASDAVSSASAAATSAVKDAISKATIPVGGGRIFGDQKVVVTQPTEGEFRAFTTVARTRAARSRRSRTAPSTPVPRQQVRHRDRRGRVGTGNEAAALEVGVGHGRRHLGLLSHPGSPAAAAVGARS